VKGTTHEDFSREDKVVLGSNRSFGLVMAGFFAILALVSLWLGHDVWHWTGSIAALFFWLLCFAQRYCVFPTNSG